jgi:hypothetical protein
VRFSVTRIVNLLIKSKEISEVVVTEKAEKELHSKSKQIDTWSETEVVHWFIENKINSTFIFEVVTVLLVQLHKKTKFNSRIFFKSLYQNDLNIKNFKIIAKFSGKLKNLFN